MPPRDPEAALDRDGDGHRGRRGDKGRATRGRRVRARTVQMSAATRNPHRLDKATGSFHGVR